MSTLQGDIGELSFILQAKLNGLEILTPISASSVYDVVIHNDTSFVRVQVKSTNSFESGSDCYKFNVGRGKSSKRKYHSSDIDYFALYIISLEMFYIIPFKKINVKTIRVYPNKKHKYNKYINAWGLLK